VVGCLLQATNANKASMGVSLNTGGSFVSLA
jgi:hypothetical protein